MSNTIGHWWEIIKKNSRQFLIDLSWHYFPSFCNCDAFFHCLRFVIQEQLKSFVKFSWIVVRVIIFLLQYCLIAVRLHFVAMFFLDYLFFNSQFSCVGFYENFFGYLWFFLIASFHSMFMFGTSFFLTLFLLVKVLIISQVKNTSNCTKIFMKTLLL